MIKRIGLIILVIAASGFGAWTLWHYRNLRRLRESANQLTSIANAAHIDSWSEAVEKVRADRGEPMGGGAGVETPPELRHYSERYWFLATQVAEVTRNKIPICQDYLELAAMIQRGDMVSVPGVTENYVLYGVAQRVDDGEFTSDDNPDLIRDYEPLRTLAKGFAGRTYNLDDPNDRQALKAAMLSSLRPAALKVLDEVASAYHEQFSRPLPVSSLVRPEQYQHSLRRVNRNAVLIESPPHSTGLAFDIDYRFMSGPEQTFLMAKLASLKNQGRIEAIRERNANYHVFVFLNGNRPSDDLITASLDDAVPPGREAHHAEAESKPAAKAAKSSKAPARKSKNKPSKTRHKHGRHR